MNILTKKIAENKQESFWYRNKTIAETTLKNGHGLFVMVSGVICITFLDTEETYHDEEAVAEAERRGYTDKDLGDKDKIYWSNNNWFEIMEEDLTGEVDSTFEDVDYKYDDAISGLEAAAQEANAALPPAVPAKYVVWMTVEKVSLDEDGEELYESMDDGHTILCERLTYPEAVTVMEAMHKDRKNKIKLY